MRWRLVHRVWVGASQQYGAASKLDSLTTLLEQSKESKIKQRLPAQFVYTKGALRGEPTPQTAFRGALNAASRSMPEMTSYCI